MSKFSKRGLRRVMGAAAAIAAATTMTLTGVTAGEADARPLANGQKVTEGLDGERVYVERRGENAFPVPTTANNPAVRGAQLSGVYTADLGGGVNGQSGLYLILGCQVDVSGITLNLSGAISLDALSASAGLTLPLAPGQVAIAKISERKIEENGKGSIQLSQYSITVNNCGGFASARTAVQVDAAKGWEIEGRSVSGEGTFLKSTLYGQPFSLN